MSEGRGSPAKGSQPPPKLVEGVGEGWEEITAAEKDGPANTSCTTLVRAVNLVLSKYSLCENSCLGDNLN